MRSARSAIMCASLRLVRTDGETIDCGPDDRPDWFAATVGGLGLTGVIVQAELQLRPSPGPWLEAEIVPYAGPRRLLRACPTDPTPEWEHTVSWIDCTSGSDARGLFMRAKPAETAAAAGLPRADARSACRSRRPSRWSTASPCAPFNALYYASQQATRRPAHRALRAVPLPARRHPALEPALRADAASTSTRCVVPRAAAARRRCARCSTPSRGRAKARSWPCSRPSATGRRAAC